jgi:hypothetical protein
MAGTVNMPSEQNHEFHNKDSIDMVAGMSSEQNR